METNSNPFIRFLLDKQKELQELDAEIKAKIDSKNKLLEELKEAGKLVSEIVK